MRIQSLPAISADNCAAFIRITPSTTDGHSKPPPSSRFPIQHKATAIPDDNLHPIGALRTEDDCHALLRILAQHLLRRASGHPRPS